MSETLEPPKLPFSRRQFPIILGGIILLIISGGIFAWQYFGVVKEEEKAPEETKDETAGWKTYQNEDYGFKIKYPKDWQVDDLTDAPSTIYFDIDRNNFLTVEEFKQQHGSFAHYDWRLLDDIKIIVYHSLSDLPGNESGLSLDEWIESRMEDHSISKNSKKEITINKYKGIEVEEAGMTSYRSIFLSHNSRIYNFFLETPHSAMNIFNQMLSTFRFLE